MRLDRQTALRSPDDVRRRRLGRHRARGCSPGRRSADGRTRPAGDVVRSSRLATPSDRPRPRRARPGSLTARSPAIDRRRLGLPGRTPIRAMRIVRLHDDLERLTCSSSRSPSWAACWSTPLVTRLAIWARRDRPARPVPPDPQGGDPADGGPGPGLRAGSSGWSCSSSGGYLRDWHGLRRLVVQHWCRSCSPALIVLAVGVVDDTRGLGPRVKLLGQAAAVLVLYLGGVRIDTFDVLGPDDRRSSRPSHLDRARRPHDRRSPCRACW